MGNSGVIKSGVKLEIAINGNGDQGDRKKIDSLKANGEQKSINDGLNPDQKSSKQSENLNPPNFEDSGNMDSPNFADNGNMAPPNFDNEPPSLPTQDSKLQDIPEQNEVSAKSNVTDNPPNLDTYVNPSIHLIRASQKNDSRKDLPIEPERSFVASRLVSGQNDSWDYSKTEAGMTMADKPRNFDKKSKGPVDWPNNVGQHMINLNMEDLNRRKEPSPKKSSKSVDSNKS
jgi:hypothetical protein